MYLKNILWVGIMFSTCYATYNPDGFMCAIIGEPTNFIKVRMQNPPIYTYLWDGTKGEMTDTKVYLDSLNLFIKKSRNGTLYIEYTIVSKSGSHDLHVGELPHDNFCSIKDGAPIIFADDCLIYNPNEASYDFSEYIITSTVNDLYDSSYNHAATKRILKTMSFLLACTCGPKIFLDDRLLSFSGDNSVQ